VGGGTWRTRHDWVAKLKLSPRTLKDLEYRIGLGDECAAEVILGGDLVVDVIVHGFPRVAMLFQPLLKLRTRHAVTLPVRLQVLLDSSESSSFLGPTGTPGASSGMIAPGAPLGPMAAAITVSHVSIEGLLASNLRDCYKGNHED
jgi:hypothetical protein